MAEVCVFCEIVAGRAPATMVTEWSDAIAFRPLNPVNEGHALVVPRVHVPHFASDPDVTAATMRRAAELMRWTPRPMNVITSRGAEATQTVLHLHLHLVPRAANDGLALPWASVPPGERDPQHAFRCQCGHRDVEHEQGSGCLAGWTWDEEGIAVQDGCHCQWAHITSPTAGARLRGGPR